MGKTDFVERRKAPRPLAFKIQHLLLAVSTVLLGLGLGLTAASMWTSAAFSRASDHSVTMMNSMREHMTADMLHDGMRGVVFRQMFAAMTFDRTMLEEGLAEVEEYGGQFRDALAVQNGLDLPDRVRASIGGVAGPLSDYLEQAGVLVRLASDGKLPEARAQLAEFDQSFKALEGAMSSVSDAIEAENAEVVSEAEAVALSATMANWGGVALTLFLTAAMVFLGRRFLSGPLIRLTAIMRELANGRSDSKFNEVQRVHEIAAMQGVVSTYRNALEDRNRLAAESERTTEEIRKRSAEAASLNGEFARVVKAAVRGDFSHRIAGTYEDQGLGELASGFNELVDSVDRAIAETGAALASLAEADLTRRVTGDYAGALAKLRDDTNAVTDKFSLIVEQLRRTSQQLRTATAEILTGSNNLADRTSKQTARIEETSATVGQLAQTVKANADRAVEAARNAEAVSRAAHDGGAIMAQANAAMERITASSARISNIIGLIDDVAFQTNLLALNASVEAARAGESGKGFAVVAIEVRRLAQSAAEASAQVKDLIVQSAAEVTEGTQLVARATASLEAMRQSVERNRELMEGIAEESNEQARGIAEVNSAVRDMDEMTQHNAALVEETNAAIGQTEAQAHELDEIVDIFVLDRARELRRAA
ncbi:methyl-accepting chemotaxis protein [Devosia sp.]|uniref:methyl-accepting chemotaxis protein n=1 Tax=Devosia sp. TaxID=1871048 RepID=UPI0035AFEC68